jgi:GAF domain-containing protein
MFNFRNFSLPNTMNAIQRSRMQFARAMVVMIFLANLGGIIAQIFVIINATEDFPPVAISFSIIFGVVCIVAWVLLQQGYVEFVVSFLVISLALFAFTFGDRSISIFISILAIIAASILLNNWIYAIAIVMVLGRSIYDIIIGIQLYGLEVREEGIFQVALLATYITLAVATRFLISTAQNVANEAQRTSTLLRTTADISQITATILDLNDLFPRAVELIRDRFVYYHVQIFLVDDNREYANLVASTGEIGQMLLERKHRLPVGSASVIGRVTQIGEPVIASDTDAKTVLHARNELLPNTRSELAVAIMDGERIIGALDVQSTRANAFSTVDIQALQVVANQLGIAIRNARLFQAQATSLQENKRLFLESEANLREIQRLNRQLTRKAWGDYLLDKRDLSGIILDKSLTDVQKDAQWTPRMMEASQKRRPSIVKLDETNAYIVAVPVVLRGEVIGAIEVEMSGELRQDDSVDIIQSVAQRLALSLDNARLFEETQLNAQQQQAINQIVSQFQSALNVDELLQMTLTEISSLVGATSGAIRLGSALVRTERIIDTQNGNGKVT